MSCEKISWVWKYFKSIDKVHAKCQVDGCLKKLVRNVSTLARHLNTHQIYKPSNSFDESFDNHDFRNISSNEISREDILQGNDVVINDSLNAETETSPRKKLRSCSSELILPMPSKLSPQPMQQQPINTPINTPINAPINPPIDIIHQFKITQDRLKREIQLHKTRKADSELRIDQLQQELIQHSIRMEVYQMFASMTTDSDKEF